jgi:sigma-B regulation protein RsbU (phosphoserine phosphatase)
VEIYIASFSIFFRLIFEKGGIEVEYKSTNMQFTEKLKDIREEIATLRAVVNGIPLGVVVADMDGKIIVFNSMVEEIFGLESNEMSLAHWSSVYRIYYADEVTLYPQELLPMVRAQDGEEVKEEVLFLKGNAPLGERWVCVTTSLLRDENGSLQGVVLTFDEITESHNAANQITEAKAKYKRLASAVEQTADSIIITNKKGIIEYVNPGFELTTGYSSQEVIGKTPRILKSGHHDQDFYKKLWGQIESGSHFRGTVLNKKKNGELYWAEQTITPLKDDQGSINNYVSVLKDITELRKKHEQDLQLSIARKVQQQLYPAPFTLHGFDLDAGTYPADETGGDFFDYINTRDGFIWISIGDVSGHGIGSALIMAETHAYVRSYTKMIADPGEVLTKVNQELSADTEEMRYVPMVLARIDLNNRSLTYANAGHVPGYLLSASGEILRTMSKTGIPLGVEENASFSSSDPIELSPGTTAIFFTDGLVEARGLVASEFGPDRVIEVVNQHQHVNSGEMVKKLYQAVRSYAGNQPQEDDITIVLLKTD